MGGDRIGSREPERACVDAMIVGAGFAGLYMLYRLRQLGMSARVFETGQDVGGVWYWNRYPGARCDVESMQYSYSFDEDLQQEWRWSERFAGQPELLAYARHVADRYGLRSDIRFETRVDELSFDEDAGMWEVATDRGDRVRATFCIMATGCLSASRTPGIEGLDRFRGPHYHTGHWPHEGVDFTGKRVGVIGTGSSGIQAIPVIAAEALRLTVFQRTPNFSVPARNVAMDEAYERSWKDNYAALRQRAKERTTSGTVYESGTLKAREADAASRRAEYETRWRKGGVNFMHAFTDIMLDEDANETAASFIRDKILATVADPDVARRLLPHDHPVGTKRICVDTDYYETYNRANVELVDLRATPIAAITEAGLRTSEAEYELDAIVFATGYDAMTGALLRIDVTGRDGLTLREKWEHGPLTYLGLMTAGFPNLFLITGPGSPSVLSNMIFAIEQHVEWIAECLAHMRHHRRDLIEAERDAENGWVEHVNEVAHRTLFPHAASWYMGANIPGKPRVFMPYCGGVVPYRQKCDEVAAGGYAGFRLAGRTGAAGRMRRIPAGAA